MRNIIVANLKQTPLEKQLIEIVERKGLGHPDYVCDAVADRISTDLSKTYLEKAGTILHHNVDKSLLRAGETEPKFNGGTVKQPMLFVIGDRATNKIDGQRIDVEGIAEKISQDMVQEEYAVRRPRRARKIPDRTETRVGRPHRHFQAKRQSPGRQRHFSSSGLRADDEN